MMNARWTAAPAPDAPKATPSARLHAAARKRAARRRTAAPASAAPASEAA
jgi:hypothetical protein